MRELYIGRNNQLRDRLYTSNDGLTWSALDLTEASDLTLQIYSDPSSPQIEVTGLANFTVDANGLAAWQPGADDLHAKDVGAWNVRWIVETAEAPDGLVFEAEPVRICE